jgi:histidine triad (HIT) family protein
MQNECIFCKIINGEIPSKKVYEDNDTLAFLDINPANPGHVLVVPKKHFENIFDIDEATLGKMMHVVKNIAKNLKEKLNPDGINIMQNNGKHAGQLVNHIHLHIIPRFNNDRVVISYPRYQISEADMDNILKKLKESTKKEEKEDFEFRF